MRRRSRSVSFARTAWRFRLIAALMAMLVSSVLVSGALFAAEKNLPVPRFVSLRAREVNVRTGPGERYPIDWVYTRRNFPVEIVAEFDNWRKIRDVDGAEGWVNEHMVTSRRSVIVRGEVRALRDSPREEADIVARAEPGVIAKLVECRPGWCRIEAKGISGWIRRDEIWGVYPNEVVDQ